MGIQKYGIIRRAWHFDWFSFFPQLRADLSHSTVHQFALALALPIPSPNSSARSSTLRPFFLIGFVS